jgi:hypothetical protein
MLVVGVPFPTPYCFSKELSSESTCKRNIASEQKAILEIILQTASGLWRLKFSDGKLHFQNNRI